MTSLRERVSSDRERTLMQRVRAGEDASLPFFLKIQIQTVSTCNAQCVTCPWPATAKSQPQGRMDDDVYETIVAQIAGRGVERTSLFLMNEPLLDPALADRTRSLKARVPDTDAVIYTNGLLLDADRARALADAGLDEIDVSVLGFTPDVYRRVMNADYRRVRDNLIAVGRLANAGTLGALRLRVVALELPGVRDGLAAFERDTGLTVDFQPVTNRAGNVSFDGLDDVADGAPATPFRACQRPFVKAYVLYNGDVVLCNCDWRRTTILGNVREESLESIWNGERLARIRRAHVARRPEPSSLCAGCDYPYLR